MTVHIYAAPSQPLTRYVDPILKAMGCHPWVVRTNPRATARCHRCGRLRWAKNLCVTVYYDLVRVFCADGPCKPRRRRKP